MMMRKKYHKAKSRCECAVGSQALQIHNPITPNTFKYLNPNESQVEKKKCHNGWKQSNIVYLLLLDASFNLLGRGFMRSEQIDSAGQVRIQNIPVFISHHQILV